MNSAPTSLGTTQAAQALYQDAQAQDAAEKAAWPYPWFQNPAYVPAAGRGAVTGRIYIADRTNNLTSAGGLWVGLTQQPFSVKNSYDFQQWKKPYQYWVKTDASGNFTIPTSRRAELHPLRLRAGRGGNIRVPHPHDERQRGPDTPARRRDRPDASRPWSATCRPSQPTGLPTQASPQFLVNVTGGATTALGTVTWTRATRYGATVFEIGHPDRNSAEFRHGEDAWAPQMPPKLGFPTPVWGARQYFPAEFPNGVDCTVGSSHWATDWNYILAWSPDANYKYHPAQGTINFSLPQAPTGGATALDLPGLRQRPRGRRRG